MSSNLDKSKERNSDLTILADNITFLMRKFNVDVKHLCKETGIATTTLKGLRRGTGNPTLSTLQILAEYFKVSLGQITESSLQSKQASMQEVYEIPVMTIEEFLSNKGNFNSCTSAISTHVEKWAENKYFAIKLTTNAMAPFFEKGTIFILSNGLFPQDADIVLVQFEKNSLCFRKIFIEGKTFYFKSISELFGDNVTTTDSFKIHGIVTKAIQNFHG